MREKVSRPETKDLSPHTAKGASEASPAPASTPDVHASLIQLQRTHGNRHVRRLLDPSARHDVQAGTTPSLAESLDRARGAGRPLDAGVRGRMEAAFGRDFGGVRLHTDSQAAALAGALDARAFTAGQDIFFRPGEYSPESAAGHELLAHELTHVVQQAGGASQTRPSAGESVTVSRPHDACEQEADRVAEAVMRGESAAPVAAAEGGPVLQRAEDKGWMETAGDYWGEVKEKAYKSMIGTLRGTQAAALGRLREMTRGMPPAMRVLAQQMISQVEMVSDILISFLLAVVGIVVGFVSGIAKALWGLLEFVHNIFYMIILFVAGFFSEQRRDEFDERANAIIEAFKNVPSALRLLLNGWLERWKAAGPDRKTLMIGELTGEIEAVLATMLGGGAAARGVPKVEFGLAPARQFATAGARGPVTSGTGAVAINVAGPPTAGVLYGAHMMSVNERARVASSEQKSRPAPEGRKTKETRPEPRPEPKPRPETKPKPEPKGQKPKQPKQPKQPEQEKAASGTSARRGGPYPAHWWKVIEDLERKFPDLKKADLRPKRRGEGPGMAYERTMTTNEFSFRAKLQDGTEIELDDILPDGTIVDAKAREYLKPRRPSGSIFDRRGLPFEKDLIDDADLLDLPPPERSFADQRRTLREVERLGDDSLLSGGSSRVWEDLTVLEELDDFNIRKAYDQMSRQARFLEETGLKRIRWYTDNVKYKQVLEEIKGALKIDIYYIF